MLSFSKPLAAVLAALLALGPLAAHAPLYAQTVSGAPGAGRATGSPVAPLTVSPAANPQAPSVTAGHTAGTLPAGAMNLPGTALPGAAPMSAGAEAAAAPAEVSATPTAAAAPVIAADAPSAAALEAAVPDAAPTADAVGEMTGAQAKNVGGRLFDALRRFRPGTASSGAETASAVEETPRPGLRARLLAKVAQSSAGRLLPARTAEAWGRKPAPPQPKTPYDKDDFGGPQGKAMSIWGKLGYGTAWAFNLLGLAAVFQYTVAPLIAKTPWPLWLPQDWLAMTGRVELLESMGPGAIAEAMASDPASFLFFTLPTAVALEELTYRVLQFGGLFLGLAALRPLAAHAPRLLDRLPDLPLRRYTQHALVWSAKLSRFAFPLAVLASSSWFAFAHIPAWGLHPAYLLTHFGLGAALAYVMYRSRSFVAPFVAHFLYNFLPPATLAAGAALLPQATGDLARLLGVFSVAFLWYSYRSYRKDKAEALEKAGRATKPRRLSRLPLALAPALLFSALGPSPELPAMPSKPEVSAAAPQVAKQRASPELSWKEVVEKIKPSVVRIEFESGLGTGFIVREDGLVATNKHVAEHAGPKGEIAVILLDGRKLDATVVALNKEKDLALIQLPASPEAYPALRLAEDDALADGTEVLAAGFPFGLPHFVSRGIVSGLNDKVFPYLVFLQHDAAINPGNSGGPLLNSRGEVVAVNTAIYGGAGHFAGIGFSSPVRHLRQAIEQFEETGSIATAKLGLIFNPAVSKPAEKGLRVDLVRPGSAAEKAGLRSGDVILAVNENELADPGSSYRAWLLQLGLTKPGSPITLLVRRAGASAQGAPEHISLIAGPELPAKQEPRPAAPAAK